MPDPADAQAAGGGGGNAAPEVVHVPEITLEEYKTMTNSAGGYRANLTRLVNIFKNTLDYIRSGDPTPVDMREADREWQALEQASEKYAQKVSELIHFTARRATRLELEGKLGTAGDEIAKLHTEYRELRKEVDLAAAPANVQPPQQQGGGTGFEKAEQLKPDKLTKRYTPAQFRVWTDRVRSYFEEAGIVNSPVKNQQRYLYNLMEEQLEVTIKSEGRIDDMTDVFGDAGIIAELEKMFLRLHPIFLRRKEFFGLSQKQGQSFSEAQAKLQELGEVSQIETLTKDEIYMFRYISMCTDKVLQRRLVKLKTQTLATYRAEVLAYEGEQAALKTEHKDSAKKAGQKKQQQQQKGNKGKGGGQGQGGNGGGKLKCKVCGKTNHGSDDCRFKDYECDYCGKQGHLKKVCRSRKENNGGGGGGNGGQQDRGRARSRSRARSAKRNKKDDSDSEEDDASNKAVIVKSAKGRPSRPTPRLKLSIGQKERGGRRFEFRATPDTGATRTLIAYDLVKEHKLKVQSNHDGSLYAANGERMQCEGTCKFYAETDDGWCVRVDALVSSSLEDEILLSWHDLQALGVLPKHFPAVSDTFRAVSEKMDFSKVNINDDEQLVAALKAEYPDVLREDLEEGKFMTGPPMRIHLREDVPVVPTRITTAPQIVKAYQAEGEKVLKELLESGVVRRVEGPTKWCARAKFVPKPGGKGLRLVADYTGLNKFVQRPVHPFPATQEIVQGLDCDAKENATNDALWGYYQIPLAEEDQELTTFILPSGRYCYTRAPMGLNASSDEWCARSDMAVAGLTGTVKLVDDILVQAPDRATLVKRLRELYEKCRSAGLTLSKKKLKLGKEVVFAGYKLTAEGVKPVEDRLAGIRDFPRPKDVTELRGFLGAANQLGFFLPDLAQVTAPLRELLKKDIAFLWLDDQEQSFRKTKELLTSDMLVKPFDAKLPTKLLTDASRNNGIGYALLQEEEDGSPRLIQCGSKSLTPTQSRYATVELEMEGVKWGMLKCDFFVRGLQHFTVITDHKPLVGVFKKNLVDVDNPRLQRQREKLLAYNFTVEWCAGKDHMIADALSRAPVFPACKEDEEEDDAEDHEVCYRVAEDPKMQMLFDSAAEDAIYKKVVAALRSGVDISKLPASHPAHQYKTVWHQLGLFDDQEDTLVVFDGKKIVVPGKAVPEILKILHMPHAGVNKTKQQARSLYFWPRMNKDVTEMVQGCEACQELMDSQAREPPLETKEPNYTPMSHVAVDLYSYGGRDYLVMVDRYSGYPFVQRLRKTHTGAVTEVMEEWFHHFGVPAAVRSDGGPQFRHEFKEWLERQRVRHEPSSAYNPTSNGLAEAAVKSTKKLLKKCIRNGEDYKAAILEYRNAPREDGYSPAQMFVGRRQRTSLPALEHAAADIKEAEEARRRTREASRAKLYERSAPLEALNVGEVVMVQDPRSKRWNDRGVITTCREHGRSYEVKTDDGASILRNRRFLRPVPKRLATRGESGGEPGKGGGEGNPKPVLKQPKSEGKRRLGEELRRSPRLAKKHKSAISIAEECNDVRYF